MQRRLAAILAADVVGYSKLMAEDEDATLTALRQHRETLFDPETAKRGGRIVKLMGDGTLVEFPSVVDAVECALAIQQALAKDDGPIKLRIGINLGDIIIDGDDIYGDGVNIAARLEALAEPGGICIASIVHESLGNRVEAEFADAGEHDVKNIDRPIRVFQWPATGVCNPSGQQLVPAELKQEQTISVTHFENLSNDDEIGYFCEGVTQDIIAALDKIAQVTVVSDDHQIGDKAPAACYILAGKVRKAGNRIRVSAQLIDSASGVQRWADRFDRDAADLFEVQDNVTRNIIIAVHTELGAGAYTNRWQWGTENFEAWQLMAQGFREFQKYSPASFARTLTIWEQALAIDPDYLAPVSGCAYCRAHLALITDGDVSTTHLAKAEAAVKRVMSQAPDDARPYSAKRGIEVARGNYEAAVAAVQIGLDMEPDSAACRATLATALVSADRPAEALAQLEKAISDVAEPSGWMLMYRVLSNYFLGNLNEASQQAMQIVAHIPDFHPGPVLAAILAHENGDKQQAKFMCQKTIQSDPQFSASLFVRSLALKNHDSREKLLNALIAAGLPE